MHYYFITGTSRGIGAALVNYLATQPNTQVYGYARSYGPTAANYTHTQLNLADSDALASFEFAKLNGASKITLINNAGLIGSIARVGVLDAKAAIDCINVNLTAPLLLCNAFLKAYAAQGVPLTICNISSGAARNPYDAWASYCSTKAGLDMLTQVIAKEQHILGNTHISCVALAPGIIDTFMQDQIRLTNPTEFSLHQNFVDYYQQGKLESPAVVAEKIVAYLTNANLPVIADLRQ